MCDSTCQQLQHFADWGREIVSSRLASAVKSKIWVRFPAPTWLQTTDCHSSSPFRPMWALPPRAHGAQKCVWARLPHMWQKQISEGYTEKNDLHYNCLQSEQFMGMLILKFCMSLPISWTPLSTKVWLWGYKLCYSNSRKFDQKYFNLV